MCLCCVWILNITRTEWDICSYRFDAATYDHCLWERALIAPCSLSNVMIMMSDCQCYDLTLSSHVPLPLSSLGFCLDLTPGFSPHPVAWDTRLLWFRKYCYQYFNIIEGAAWIIIMHCFINWNSSLLILFLPYFPLGPVASVLRYSETYLLNSFGPRAEGPP